MVETLNSCMWTSRQLQRSCLSFANGTQLDFNKSYSYPPWHSLKVNNLGEGLCTYVLSGHGETVQVVLLI